MGDLCHARTGQLRTAHTYSLEGGTVCCWCGDRHEPNEAAPTRETSASKRCRSCRFFDCDPGMPDEDWAGGLCRRHSPSLMRASGYIETKWPPVRGIDWCGEHEPRESEVSHV